MEAQLVKVGDIVSHNGVVGKVVARTGVFETNGVLCVVLVAKSTKRDYVHTWKVKANRVMSVSR